MDEFPSPFAPMLADEVKRPFHRAGWGYEEKYDGYRMIAYRNGDRVQLISRNQVARRLAADGLEAWQEVVAKGWEGLIAKDPTSIYEPGVRTRGWIKVKHKVRIGWPGEGTEYTRG